MCIIEVATSAQLSLLYAVYSYCFGYAAMLLDLLDDAKLHSLLFPPLKSNTLTSRPHRHLQNM